MDTPRSCRLKGEQIGFVYHRFEHCGRISPLATLTVAAPCGLATTAPPAAVIGALISFLPSLVFAWPPNVPIVQWSIGRLKQQV